MRHSTRLFANTIVTLCRMALTVVLGLVATRLALGVLGDERYGVIGVLGAAGALLNAITDALNQSIMRHLSVELGRQDQEKLRRVFSTAFFTFVGIAAGAAILGAGLAPMINRLVNIPEAVRGAAASIFLATVVRLAIAVVATPFRALALAHQALILVAVAEVLASILMLASAAVITFVPGDQLVWYAWLLAGAGCFVELTVVVVVLVRYRESRAERSRFSRTELTELWHFGAWTFVGNVGWQLRNQGSQFILNAFYGVRANAGYTVAMQAAAYQSNLSSSVLRATDSLVMRSGGTGDAGLISRLTIIQGKYAALSALSFVAPAVLESTQLLTIWLRSGVPDTAVLLTPLMIIAMWIQAFSNSLLSPIMASGVVGPMFRRNTIYEFVGLGFAIAVLSVALPGLWFLPSVIIVIATAQTLMRAKYVEEQWGLTLGEWARRAVRPVALTALASFAAGSLPRFLMAPSALRVGLVVVASGLALAVCGWLVALEPWERDQFRRLLTSIKARAWRVPQTAGA